MRSILRMMLVLVLLLAAGAGGAAYWLFVRSDELLKSGALRQLTSLAPDLKFGLDRANYDFTGRACLYGLSIQLPGDVEPSLYIPEAVATLDQQQMTDFENVVVTRLRIVKPVLRVVRHADGQWSWQGIKLQRNTSGGPLPDIEIEHGTAIVEFHRKERATRKIRLADLNVVSITQAEQRLGITASTRVDPAGPLKLKADVSLVGGKWNAEANWLSFPIDDEFLKLLADISPEAEDKLRAVKQMMADAARTQVASTPLNARPLNVSPAIAGGGQHNRPSFVSQPRNAEATGPHGGSAVSAPAVNPRDSQLQLESRVQIDSVRDAMPIGLRCLCDLTAQIGQADSEEPIQFRTLAKVRSGQISNTLLPFPLYELRGSAYVDNQQAIIKDLHAENGAAAIDLNANVQPGRQPNVELKLKGIELSEALKSRLPETARKLLNSLSLTGICDAIITSREQDSRLKWDVDLTIRDGTAAHEKFPLKIRDVTGTIRLRDNVTVIESTGFTSGAKCRLIGTVTNPGPEQEATFDIRGNDIQLDDDIREACPPVVKKTLNELNLRGRGDVWLRLTRSAGLGQRFQSNLVIKGRGCSMSYRQFPYAVQNLSGLVTWNGETVTFKELVGDHDGATLKAEGRYGRLPSPGRLDLVIDAENAAFDRGLEAALTPSLRQVWNEFQPQGRFNCRTVIGWVPGQPVEVSLPSIRILEGDVELVSFPWKMHEVTAEMAFEQPRLTVKSFAARHDDTQIRGRATADVVPNQPWRVTFNELFIDDLIPNASFRKALPASLRQVFETLDPSGKFSISTSNAALQGAGEVLLVGPRHTGDNVAARWNLHAVLAGCALSAGLRIEDIHGSIISKGEFDGEQTNFAGRVDFNSVSICRDLLGIPHQITSVKGPISLKNGIFVAGSREQAETEPNSPPIETPLSERISGDAIDGRLTLDARADVRKEVDYRVNVSLKRGLLERYAQRYLRGQTDLAGVMNGGLRVWGKGNDLNQIQGRGRVEIAPAALYELPLFVRMFRLPEFVRIFRLQGIDTFERKAFDRADLQFSIGQSRFYFEKIDLIGESLSLRGRGFIRFDGAMQLDFYSMLARSQVRFPVVHEIAKNLFRGWMRVKVTGTVGDPQTVVVPGAVADFDDATKQFLGNFDPRPVAPPAKR